MKDYFTCAQDAEFELVEKKSRFIAHCCRIVESGDAENLIMCYRKRFWDARHNCYAFRLPNTERSSDDGEPAGTAGIPILTVLRMNRIMNVLIVVTRYFGGVLLGTGGLARAYTKAASEALRLGGIQWMRPCIGMHTEIAYSDYSPIEKFFRDKGIHTETVFSEVVSIDCFVPEEEVSSVSERVIELTEGRSGVITGRSAYIAYPADSGILQMEK